MTTTIPAGYKLVPEIMTLDMCVAFAEAWFSKVRCIDDHDMQDAYAAMINAAPAAPGVSRVEDAQVPEFGLEAAAKTLAECMDYPWEWMSEKGRSQMRLHAQAIIDAARAAQRKGGA